MSEELRYARRHLILVALVVLVGWNVLMSAYMLADKPVIGDPTGITGHGEQFIIAPASGIEGFDVYPFCNDPATTVKAFPAPDAAGNTYQLTRLRDEKPETVTVALTGDSITFAKHYWSETSGQVSEDAFVTQAARDCILKKAN